MQIKLNEPGGGTVSIPTNSLLRPDLVVAKTAAQNCQNITYTITYNNKGTTSQLNTILVDTYDKTKVTPIEYSGGVLDSNAGTITWSLGEVPIGGPYTKTFKVKINDGGCKSDTVQNSVKINGDRTDSNSADNSNTVTTTVVPDTTKPVLIGVPSNVTVACDKVPAAASVTATDNCDAKPTVTLSEVKTNGNCPGNYTLKRTWTATDSCGNSNSTSQTITVRDITKPVLSGVPADVTVECNAVPAVPTTVTATDNCDSNPTITFNQTTIAGACPNNYTLERTWTAKDSCNNAVLASQNITVRDTKPPVLSGVPVNATVQCNAVPAVPTTITATDNCDPNPTITFSQITILGNCPNNYTLKRTWTAKDSCNNAASATQILSVVDTQKPSITCPAGIVQNADPGKCEATVTITAPTATDLCGSATVSGSRNDGKALNDLYPVGNTTITWTARDACGNTNSCTQTVTIVSQPTQITGQPTTQTTCDGGSASFTVTATGSGTLTYQWWFKATGATSFVQLSGATSATLNINPVSSANAGTYHVVVHSACGDDVTSDDVTLTINPPTQITGQPTAQTACDGGSASFTVTATGTAPITYQWWFKATGATSFVQITGATSSTLDINPVSSANAGTYHVVVHSECGDDVTSDDVGLTINPPTQITAQPTAQTACDGGSASFTITATGTAPITYQWWFKATGATSFVQLTGATSATLDINPVSSANAGTYHVVVHSECGDDVTSDDVGLTINPPTQITAQPTAQTACDGGSASFTVTVSGAGSLTYQWYFRATGASTFDQITGATSSTLDINPVSSANAGAYHVVVHSECGEDVTSDDVDLTINPPTQITGQPTAQTACDDGSASFTVTAIGTAPITYQWWFKATGATSFVQLTGATSATLDINPVSSANAGTYHVVVHSECGDDITSDDVDLTVNPPTQITGQPTAQTACEGGSASFTVTAIGTAPITYQWWFKATGATSFVQLTGATSAILDINPVSSANAGTYHVVVHSACGEDVTSDDVDLTVNPPTQITGQPTAQTACDGGSASFTVTATGTAPITYQWWFKATGATSFVQVAGATSSTLDINPASSANAGTYHVVVHSECGEDVTSDDVDLTINPPTQITGQPTAQTACDGGSASFTVTATGAGTLTYQWYFRATGASTFDMIAGATSSTLDIDPVSPANAGTYHVVVHSACGEDVTSDDVDLTVNALPTVTVASVEICPGDTATLTASVVGCTAASYQWYTGDSPSPANLIQGATSGTYQTDAFGSYTCQAACDTGCKSHGTGSVSSKPPGACVLPGGQFKISGTKFHDLDGSGTNNGEPGLGGWTIQLKDTEGNVLDSTTTSSDAGNLGYYEFTDLTPGTYVVSEVLQTGWSQTKPSGGSAEVVVTIENPIQVVDFGNKLSASPLVVTKVADAAEIVVGSTITFTITVTNSGDASIENVELVDNLGPGLIYDAVNSQPKADHINGNSLTWDLGTLGPQESREILLRAVVDPTVCPLEGGMTVLTSLPPAGGELSIMAAESDPEHIQEIIDALTRNKTKLEVKLESIKKHRDAFNKTRAIMISSTKVVAGANHTLNNYTDVTTGESLSEVASGESLSEVASGESLSEELNATGFLIRSEYRRPAKEDLLVTEYGAKGEVISEFYNFMPTKESLQIYYDQPEKGYRTYYVRYYANGDTLILVIDPYGNVISREYRKTPGAPVVPNPVSNCAKAYGTLGGLQIESNEACAEVFWVCQSIHPVYGLKVTKKADRQVAAVGDAIKYEYTVENTGSTKIVSLTLNDDKLGMVIFNQPVDLDPGASFTYERNYTVKGSDAPLLRNTVVATGVDPNGVAVTSSPAQAEVKIVSDDLIKTAWPKVVKPGDYVTYTITWKDNLIGFWLVDKYPSGVSFVSATPAPTVGDNNWSIKDQESGTITILVQVAQDIGNTSFDMGQGVTGTGFVNVHNDISTKPVILTNKATILNSNGGIMATASANVNIGPPQTSVSLREHGSGDYASEELIKYRNYNRSIQWNKSLQATYKPTVFPLPKGRSIGYGTKWTEKAKSKNYATGASTNEEYTYANMIDRDSSLKLDENGSTMVTDTEFEGVGHIGLLKKANANETLGVTSNASTAFEAQEDYVGNFQIHEKFDEYGKNVEYQKSVSGLGYVSADRRVGSSQASYESGTGRYQSDEKISTIVSYMAKDINLVHAPTSYNYTPNVRISNDLKWKEGMYSKTPESMIGEEFSSLESLKKNTAARGLGEMETEASFTGKAEFRTVYEGYLINSSKNMTNRLDIDDEYAGQYDIKRKTVITGIAKYDRPHITLTKKGNADLANTTFVDYRITVENSGNRALGPVDVKDVFPPGTVYITSSLRPTELTGDYVTWTLPTLGIGSKATIDLRLNIVEEPANLVNRVEAAGEYGDNLWTVARSFSAIQLQWLTCCPPQISAYKTARLDPSDPKTVWYSLKLQNKERYTMVAFLIDRLPGAMQFLNSSLEPSEERSDMVTWTILDLGPGESREIVYRARAEKDGIFVNSAHIEAYSVDGPDAAAADVTSRVEIGVGGGQEIRGLWGDWTAPACFGLNCSGGAYGTDWVPCFTCGGNGSWSSEATPPCLSCMDTGDDSIP